MTLQAQLDRLQTRLAEALRELPGATALYLCGSRATGEADQYADIDLQVFTADCATAHAVWPQCLEAVGPIEVAFPLSPEPANSAFAILFSGESYYHKCDIGLSHQAEIDHFIASRAPHRQLWSQKPARAETTASRTLAYIPPYGTTGHLVIDELIASVRYTKARKRGHDLTGWRFMRSKLERLLQLLYEQSHDWKPCKEPLTTWQYKYIDIIMNGNERHNLLRQLDWSEPRAMDQSCYWFTRQIIQLAQHRTAVRSESLPAEIIERQLAFIRTELDL
jgi:hypothetical protein